MTLVPYLGFRYLRRYPRLLRDYLGLTTRTRGTSADTSASPCHVLVFQKIHPHNCHLGSITSAFWGDGTYSDILSLLFWVMAQKLISQDYPLSADVFSSENKASIVLSHAHELSCISNRSFHVCCLYWSMSVTRLKAVCSFVCAVWRVRCSRRNNCPIFAAVSRFWQYFSFASIFPSLFHSVFLLFLSLKALSSSNLPSLQSLLWNCS